MGLSQKNYPVTERILTQILQPTHAPAPAPFVPLQSVAPGAETLQVMPRVEKEKIM